MRDLRLNKDVKWLYACDGMADLFSTCARKKYAAFIVDQFGICVGFGYNGAPSGHKHCVDGGCGRAFSDVPHGSQYDSGDGACVAVHAEHNALFNTDPRVRAGTTLYVNGPPCEGCLKMMHIARIKRCVYWYNAEYVEYDTSKYNVEMVCLR